MSINREPNEELNQKPNEEPLSIDVDSEDFDIRGSHLVEQSEAIEADLDKQGRAALEVLFISPYLQEFSDRESMLAVIIHNYQEREQETPGTIDAKITEITTEIIKLQDSVNHWKEQVEKYSNEPEVYIAYKNILNNQEDVLKSNEALLETLKILKDEK